MNIPEELKEYAPFSIQSKEDLERAIKIFEPLFFKLNRTEVEDKLLSVWTDEIERYAKLHYPIGNENKSNAEQD